MQLKDLTPNQLTEAYMKFCVAEGLPDYWPAFTIYQRAQHLTKEQRDGLLRFAEAYESLGLKEQS